jgi:hypothetical protein
MKYPEIQIEASGLRVSEQSEMQRVCSQQLAWEKKPWRKVTKEVRKP